MQIDLRGDVSQRATAEMSKWKAADDGAVLRHVTLILTYRCQLRCKMCGQVDAPIDAPNTQKNHTMMPTDLVLQRLEEVGTIKSAYLFGGEPLLHKDIFKILHHCKDRKIKTMFSTNGLLLTKFAPKLVEARPDVLSISIDSHVAEVHDQIRGMKGSFERALAAADGFLRYRQSVGATHPRLKIHCTITPDNYRSLLEFYDYMFQRFPDTDDIRFHFPRFATAAMGQAYEEIMTSKFGSRGMSWQGNFSNDELTQQFIDIDTAALSSMIKELLQRPKITITGPTDSEEIEEFFRQPGKMPEGRSCVCSRSVAIQPGGEVVTCADYPDYVLGNIHENSLSEIWAGEKAVGWRRYLRENGNPGVMVKCSRLYAIVGSKAKVPA